MALQRIESWAYNAKGSIRSLSADKDIINEADMERSVTILNTEQYKNMANDILMNYSYYERSRDGLQKQTGMTDSSKTHFKCFTNQEIDYL